MIAESGNFLELDFFRVLEILSSSQLLITSELEVYNSVNAWLSHNLQERSKFGKDLLLTVRFPLLSDVTIKTLIGKPSSFSGINVCYNILQEISESKEKFFQNKSIIYHTIRYCSQQMFDILVCGGRDTRSRKAVEKVSQIDASNLKSIKVVASMTEKRQLSKAASVKGEVYVFGGVDSDWECVDSVEKYSPTTNTWEKVADMYDDRKYNCACAFMNKVLVFGGNKNWTAMDSCLQFDTKDYSWKEVARMNEARYNAACAVFQGTIVVSGGNVNNRDVLKTVESFDVVADTWIPMPSMTQKRNNHNLVAVNNKLFVTGVGELLKCQVYDRVSDKFVDLKCPYTLDFNKALSIENRILIFEDNQPFMVIYDADNEEWSRKSCEATEHLIWYSCLPLPLQRHLQLKL